MGEGADKEIPRNLLYEVLQKHVTIKINEGWVPRILAFILYEIEGFHFIMIIVKLL